MTMRRGPVGKWSMEPGGWSFHSFFFQPHIYFFPSSSPLLFTHLMGGKWTQPDQSTPEWVVQDKRTCQCRQPESPRDAGVHILGGRSLRFPGSVGSRADCTSGLCPLPWEAFVWNRNAARQRRADMGRSEPALPFGLCESVIPSSSFILIHLFLNLVWFVHC